MIQGLRIFTSIRMKKGFTLNELDKAGITAQNIILHNIPTDLERKKDYQTNIDLLRIWKANGFIAKN